MTQRLEERIKASFDSLSEGKRRLARFILDRWDEAAFCTASELGRKVGISQSVVVRFAMDIGYPGYPELQQELQEQIKRRVTTVDRFRRLTDAYAHKQELVETIWRQDLDNIERTIQANPMEALDRAVELMVAAERVFVTATSATAAVGVLLAHNLDMVLGNAWFLSNHMGQMFDRLRRVGRNDLVIGVSFPRYSALTYNAMRLAHRKGAGLIAISDSLVSPIAKLADLSLVVRVESVSFARSHVAGVSLANTLFAILGMKASERVGQALEAFERDREFWTSSQRDLGGGFTDGEEPRAGSTG